MGPSSLWQRFQNYFLRYDDLDFSIDISRMKFPDDFFDKMKPRIGKAFRMSESPPVMSGLTTNSHSRNSG
jgi:glucose-6-phosphate isomerase